MATPPPTNPTDRRTQLRARWEALLRTRLACSPLAHPDTLVHLLDTTLDTLFAAPRPPAARPAPAKPCRNSCRCGLNPLLDYFAVGEQALRETDGDSTPGAAGDGPVPADAMRLHHALRRLARDELETFCSLCQKAGASPFLSPTSVLKRQTDTDKSTPQACRARRPRPPFSPSSHENHPRPR